jgi:hypothetical protein
LTSTSLSSDGLIVFSLQRPILTDNDNDNEVVEMGRSTDGKKIATAGRKPKITVTSAVFQQIWKTANKEMKCFIFFTNPFPGSEDYEFLPPQVYKKAVNLLGQSEYHDKTDLRSRAQQEYGPEWASGVGHKPFHTLIVIHAFTAIA